MYSDDMNKGSQTPPLRNHVSNDLQGRLEELLKQENKIAEEYDNLKKNRLTEEKMLSDIQERQASYNALHQGINNGHEKLKQAKLKLENDPNIEISRSRLLSEEDSYRGFYSSFISKCRDIESEHHNMEDEFAKINTILVRDFDILQNQDRKITADIDLTADEIRKAEESVKARQSNALELQKVRLEIVKEENHSNTFQKSVIDVIGTLKEREQMITQAELQLDAIRNQCANEKRIHEDHIALLMELETLLDRATSVASEYMTTKDLLKCLEKNVQQACENELRVAPP